MKLSLYGEATNCAANQELAIISWNQNVRYCGHNSPRVVPILSQINPVHATSSYLSKLHLLLGLPSGLLPSGIHTTSLQLLLYGPSHSTCPIHLTVLDLTNLIILCREYKLRNMFCSFLQHPVTLSFLGPNSLLSSLFSNTPRVSLTYNVRDQVFAPMQNHKTKL
jgi:hypothetical protein